jgi:hypothetical protein
VYLPDYLYAKAFQVCALYHKQAVRDNPRGGLSNGNNLIIAGR